MLTYFASMHSLLAIKSKAAQFRFVMGISKSKTDTLADAHARGSNALFGQMYAFYICNASAFFLALYKRQNSYFNEFLLFIDRTFSR